MLREMNDSDQRVALLDRMEADIKTYELQNKTGNSVLDTLLTGKSMQCNKHGITMTVVADGTLLDFMDAMDICSIFGNALDNAIEASLKISDKKKRLIHLSVSQFKSFVMICIENYFEDKLIALNDGYATTKKNAKDHGYGIKSINYTTDHYNGVVDIKVKDNWFKIKILIPIKDSN
jgi:sensor histidine kinase regulating citrate/malate metabolism